MRQRFDLEAFLHLTLIGPHGLGNEAVDVEVTAGDHQALSDRIEHPNRFRKAFIAVLLSRWLFIQRFCMSPYSSDYFIIPVGGIAARSWGFTAMALWL